MSNEEIQIECEKMYQQVQDATIRLDELRKVCKHEQTHEGLYCWRIGSTFPASICNYCGQLIRRINELDINFFK